MSPVRSRWLAVGLIGGALALVVAAVVVDLRAVHPDRVSTRVTRCDLGSYGAAQVGYQLRNGDRTEHTYRVEIWVKDGAAPVGYTESEVNYVGAGVTTTGRALIPVTAGVSAANCSVHASVFDGRPGHRHA